MTTFPKYNLLYYKNVLDRCFQRFFEDYSDSFAKDEDGRYVLSKSMSKTMLVKIFEAYMLDELGKYVVEYSESRPEFFFIIGSCVPSENVALLEMEKDGSVPKKLKNLIDVIPDIRYFLREQDISVDMRLFNSAFERIFVKYLSRKKTVGRNVFFIRHWGLDCYFLFKTLKRRYGSHVVNLHKKNALGDDRCIFSVNEIIDSKCGRKLEILNSDAMKPLKGEIYQYIDTLLEKM